MTYYMTIKRNCETGYWEKCKAKTLTGAKREATAEYKDDYTDALLVIAEGDNVDNLREIAYRQNRATSKWASQHQR